MIDIKINDEAVTRFLSELPAEIEVATKRMSQATADLILRKIKQFAPSRSGDLARSFFVERTSQGFVVRSTLPYVGFQNARKQFLERAIDAAIAEIDEIANRELADATKRASE